jgi:hypothetical protein
MKVEIDEPTGGIVIIKDGTKRYEIHHDPYTGDWQVTSPNDSFVQGEWMQSKEDGIRFVLSRVGVFKSADFDRAPTRCDA